MAEVIITEFRAETGQFTASIDAAEASVVGLDNAEKSAQKSTAGLTQQLGSATGKAAAHKAAMAEVAKATDTAANGSSALGKALASANFSGAAADGKALASVLVSLGGQGQAAFDALNLSAENTIDVLRQLIVEASKTPQGAAALASELTEAQQAALSTLQTMGALNAEEAEVVAQAVKLGAAQSQVSEETKETATEYVSLRTQVKKAKEELDKMIDASDGKITPELIAAAKKAGELQDRFEDISATVEAFNPDKKFAAFSGVVTNLAGGFTAIQGALALVGGESESVSRGLLKVQSALAISQGLQSLFGGLKDNLNNLKLVLSASTAGATALAGSTTAAASATGLAAAATRAWNAALASSGIGAIVIAIGSMVAALLSAKSATDELNASTERQLDLARKAAEETGKQSDATRSSFLDREVAEGRLSQAQAQRIANNSRLKKQEAELLAQLDAEGLKRQEILNTIETKESRLDLLQKSTRESAAIEAVRVQSEIEGLKSRLPFIKVTEDAIRRNIVLLKQEAENRDAVLAANEKTAQSDKTKAPPRASRYAREAVVDNSAARIAAEQAVAQIIREIDAAATTAALTETEKRDAAIRASFEKQVAAAKDAFSALAALTPDDAGFIALAEESNAKIVELEALMNAELERLRAEDIAGVRDYSKTKEEIEIAAVNKKFDLQAEETARLIESEEERTAILKAIEENRLAELAGIRTEAQEQELAQQQAQQDASINALGAFAQASSALLAGMAQGQEDAAKNFAKASLSIAFDAVNAMLPIWSAQILGKSVSTLGPAGLAQAAALTALLKGVLAGLRSTLGFAEGGEVTLGSGPRVKRSNGDNVLATLQDREIVLSRASRVRAERMFGKGVWGDLGVPGFGGSVDWTNALARAGAASSARDGGAVIASRDDRRIIGALGGVGSLREQRRQTELLEELARTRGRNPRARWA